MRLSENTFGGRYVCMTCVGIFRTIETCRSLVSWRLSAKSNYPSPAYRTVHLSVDASVCVVLCAPSTRHHRQWHAIAVYGWSLREWDVMWDSHLCGRGRYVGFVPASSIFRISPVRGICNTHTRLHYCG